MAIVAANERVGDDNDDCRGGRRRKGRGAVDRANRGVVVVAVWTAARRQKVTAGLERDNLGVWEIP